MRVYRRGKKWYMDARDARTGDRERRPIVAESKREAERVMRAIVRKWELGELLPTERETVPFGRLMDEYAKVYVRGGRNRNGKPHKASTVVGDEGRIKFIKEHFGDRPVGEIGADDVEAFLELLTAKERSVATRNRYLAVLRPALRLAVARGWLAAMPDLPHQRKEALKVETVLSDEDLAKFLGACDRIDGLGQRVRFLLLTGFRLGEAFVARTDSGLRWEDVDFARGTVTLRDTKAGEDAMVRVHGGALVILRDQYAAVARTSLREGAGKPTGPVWAGHALDDTRKLRDAFKGALRATGADTRYRIHDLRAQFAVALLKQGEDIVTVSKALRHKSIGVTARYLRHVEGHVEKAVGRLVLPAAAQ